VRAADVAATGPTTATTQAADFSEPKKTMQTLATAVTTSDPALIRSCLYIDPEFTKPAEVLLATMQASMRYKKAIISKFGPAAEKEIEGAVNPAELMSARMKAVEDATVAITGDTAVMTLSEPASANNPGGVSGQNVERKITFRKVGDLWKIDAVDMMRLNDPKVQNYLPLMGSISNAMNMTAGEIESDKVGTLQEAKQILSQRVIAVLQEARKNAAPAAAVPTTVPATQP